LWLTRHPVKQQQHDTPQRQQPQQPQQQQQQQQQQLQLQQLQEQIPEDSKLQLQFERDVAFILDSFTQHNTSQGVRA
jgi:hypothetical protein